MRSSIIVVVGGLIFHTPFILFGTLPLFFIGLVCTGLLAAASYAASFQSEPPPKANMWDRFIELWKEYPEGRVVTDVERYDQLQFFAYPDFDEYTSIDEEHEYTKFYVFVCDGKVVLFWKNLNNEL